MARRSGSTARHGERNKSGRGAPRPRSDGKVDVFCPQCAAQFRVAADALDQKIQCTECHRTFFPKTAVGKRRQAPNYTKAYVGFGALALFIVVTLVLMSGGGSRPASNDKETPPPQVVDRGRHPRAVQVKDWAAKVHANDKFGILGGVDLTAMQAQFGLPSADGDAVAAAFATHESAQYLRDLEITASNLEKVEDAEAPTGAVMLYLSPPRDSTKYAQNRGQCQVKVQFRAEGGLVKVTGWSVVKKPVELGTVGGPHHDKIEKPKEAVTADGRKVTESEPCALDHLASATPEMRQQIDKLVDDLLASANPDAPGGLRNRTVEKMKKVGDRGREVVPRLLNKMFEFYADPIANNPQLTQLCSAANDITGNRFAYSPKDSGDAQKDKAARQSAIRQWFAYWYSGFQRDWNIEKEESLQSNRSSAQQPAVKPPDKK